MAEQAGNDVQGEIPDPPDASTSESSVNLPRIAIKFCTQCKWMLRAAYFAQELLSTFSTALGEVALVPATGGVFTVTMLHTSNADFTTQEEILWDRKSEGGFPEVKHLKSLVRNIIDPSRDLGHIDRSLKKSQQAQSQSEPQNDGEERKKPLTVAAVGETPGGSGQPRPGHQHSEGEVCEDCG